MKCMQPSCNSVIMSLSSSLRMSEGRAEKDVVAEENVRAEGVVIEGDENKTVEQKTEAISAKRMEFHERTMKKAKKTVDNQQKSETTVENDKDTLNKKQKKGKKTTGP